MKWKKCGLIFDAPKYSLNFAQSPQALVFKDFVRIYFSTREVDASGKYLSHIAYIEMSKSLKHIMKISKHRVIELGKMGCFDEHGIFPLNVVRDGSKVLGYIGGWSRRKSVSVETSIGLAVSEDDGLSFKRLGDGPVLASSLNEPFLVGDPFVSIIGGIYHMWYIYGTRWIEDPGEREPQRVYKIGHALSKSGIEWEKSGKQIIEDKLNSNECQALPTVIRINNRYHMFFCYREATDFRKNEKRGYRIGTAFSDDLVTWTRDDENVGIDIPRESWESGMMCYPHVFQWDDNIYLLYNGNEFGRYGFGAAILEAI